MGWGAEGPSPWRGTARGASVPGTGDVALVTGEVATCLSTSFPEMGSIVQGDEGTCASASRRFEGRYRPAQSKEQRKDGYQMGHVGRGQREKRGGRAKAADAGEWERHGESLGCHP